MDVHSLKDLKDATAEDIRLAKEVDDGLGEVKVKAFDDEVTVIEVIASGEKRETALEKTKRPTPQTEKGGPIYCPSTQSCIGKLGQTIPFTNYFLGNYLLISGRQFTLTPGHRMVARPY